MKRHIYHSGYFKAICKSRVPFFIQWLEALLVNKATNCDTCENAVLLAFETTEEGCALCNAGR